jgi:vacuolar-type H+-ATPase subunit C/Vma6
MSIWVDVVARARGLSTQVLGDRQLGQLAHAHDLGELVGELVSRSIVSPATGAEPRPLELSLQRRAGARLRLIARWSGQRSALLAPLLEDEDRRAIRALVRGAVAHAPAEQRLAGLVPTPTLPIRALDELAALGDPAAVAALLVTWRNPYGTAILDESRRQQPDLLQIESTLTRVYAERSRRVAPRCGRAMRVFVARTVDLENLWTAILLAEHGAETGAAALHVEGGDLLKRDAFVLAASAHSRREATAILIRLVADTPLAVALGSEPDLEERALRALVREQRGIARLDPLGPAPIIELVLRSRGELLALRRIIWGLALGAPLARRGASTEAGS